MFWCKVLIALPLVYAARLPVLNDRNDHSHSLQKRLPTSWHQPDDHPVHALFRRGAPTDGNTYPQVGTPTWSAAYPSSSPDTSDLPQEWVDALNAAVSAGKIPDIPQSSNTPGTNPVYPTGYNPNGPEVCSATYKCVIPGDVWNGPSGYWATSFDDGPTDVSDTLLEFLEENNQTATHFMIGIQIMYYPQYFLDIFNAGHDIAVHTWTHPYMTTLSNLEIVGQLGWTAELIRNSTGGRVPRYWRPPYGDSDTRVRAIALEVFGLTTVLWNHDTEDWSIGTDNVTEESVHANIVQWLAGPKSPGIIVLEHELSNDTITAYMDAFPLIGPAGWQTASLLTLIGNGTNSTYQNSDNSESPVTAADIIPNPSASATVAGETAAVSTGASSTAAKSTSTLPATSASAAADKTGQKSNAGTALAPYALSSGLPYIVISLCAPALVAFFSILI